MKKLSRLKNRFAGEIVPFPEQNSDQLQADQDQELLSNDVDEDLFIPDREDFLEVLTVMSLKEKILDSIHMFQMGLRTDGRRKSRLLKELDELYGYYLADQEVL